MNTAKKIEYYDLREEASAERLRAVVGRTEEMERLSRIIGRRMNSNVLIVGQSGVGKTSLVYGWMRRLSRRPHSDIALLQMKVEHLHALDEDGNAERLQDALSTLPPCILFIDDFGREVQQNTPLIHSIQRLYKRTLRRPDVHVILTLETHEYAWLLREHTAFVQMFETVTLKEQSSDEYTRILESMVPHVNSLHRVIIPDSALREVVTSAERFPTLGQLPRSAIHLLDECISHSAAKKRKILTADSVAEVVEAKTGVPRARLGKDELRGVKILEESLNARIVDQGSAIRKIATALQRAKLGLKNPHRPMGSFLLLGPSGVGKTETAKCVAEIMFGRAESFTRFDMSEFQQDHTVQRLIGAPAGYIGYEEGGALTNALRKEPHSLILLDEIEKAHPKVFDIFLQVLDDGRLSSGQNETVDARNAILMATSNVGVAEILRAFEERDRSDDEAFITERVMPILAQTFRLEFINRFDSILIFKPLAIPSLIRIAQLEVRKMEKRLVKHNVRFDIDSVAIEERIRNIADPRFGARPVKRFIEETCETLLMRSLLTSSHP